MNSSVVHKITAYVLVLILFSHNINTLMVISAFVVNQAAIAKNFCVQKDDQRGCNGKCHLSQLLKQSTPESNTDLPAQETRRMSLDAFCLFDVDALDVPQADVIYMMDHSYGLNQNLQNRYLDIETPPPNFI